MKLEGKVALVTGGSRGIGKAIALKLAREGARVVVNYVNGAKEAAIVVEEIKSYGGEAMQIMADVSKKNQVNKMISDVIESYGGIDILVNNAGILIPTNLMETSEEEWDKVMAVNLKGPFLCTRAVFPYMREQKAGKIINITSDTFFLGRVHLAHYVASKGGVIGLTRVLANELGQFNINVNCIAPGSTFSEDPDNLNSLERRKQVVPLRALQRVEYPQDLVGTVIFLASSDSDFITGQTIAVNGGMTMS